MAETNMRVLTPSRKKQRAGDVFVLQMPDGLYSFGRVISTSAVIGPMTGCVLIYVFRSRSTVKEPRDDSKLRADDLLVPPIMTNRLPWTRGYFETIAHWPLEAGDVLNQHCFYSTVFDLYFDEKSNELPGPVEPVGDRGLHSFRTIDDQISDALGFARVSG